MKKYVFKYIHKTGLLGYQHESEETQEFEAENDEQIIELVKKRWEEIKTQTASFSKGDKTGGDLFFFVSLEEVQVRRIDLRLEEIRYGSI